MGAPALTLHPIEQHVHSSLEEVKGLLIVLSPLKLEGLSNQPPGLDNIGILVTQRGDG